MQIALLKRSNSSNSQADSKILLFRFYFLFLSAIWIVGFLVPAISTIDNPLSYYILEKFYSTVCHQEITKTIFIENEKMLVCARCAGIYSGAFISAISILLILTPFKSKIILILSLMFLFADVLLTSSGVYSYSQNLAFITGFIFGSVVYIFIIIELENFIIKKQFYSENE